MENQNPNYKTLIENQELFIKASTKHLRKLQIGTNYKGSYENQLQDIKLAKNYVGLHKLKLKNLKLHRQFTENQEKIKELENQLKTEKYT